jgi:class 3 adenylate cyclase/tetratricopeptide (TPR) repeat protein
MIRCLTCNFANPDGISTCQGCGAAVGLACAQCGAANPVFAKFCGGCGARVERASDAPASLDRAERRQMTVLFCDVVGSTQLSRKLDPEDWHRIVNRLHSECGEIIAKHHGHVAQYLGDGLLAYFGYPVAAQGDARRAVAAGLELTRQAANVGDATEQGIKVRVGIHTGLVVVGNIGSGRHQESLALGETPNLAARVQELAPPDSVVVSPATHHLVSSFFSTSELGTFVPKGFLESLMLYRILDGREPTTPFETATLAELTPLVGRSAESAAMTAAWERAVAGRASVLLLIGEAGIGKSRLIHTLKQWLETRRVRDVHLRCSEHAKSSAFHPVIERLQREAVLRHGESSAEIVTKLNRVLKPAGLTEQQVALIATLFAPLRPDAASSQPVRPALIDALCTWIGGDTPPGPTLFVVEDLHWADPSTLELLDTWVARSAAGAVLTVVSSRPEFSPSWASGERVRILTPARLGLEDTRTLIARVAGGESLPAEIVEQLAARAEGIPLFLEEMTKAILQSGVLRRTAAGYELERPLPKGAIPATLSDSLTGRLDQLGPNKPIAQLAAVLGREFSRALLEAVWHRLASPPDLDLAAGLDAVVGAQLITRRDDVNGITYEFKHSLLQEAAYQSLLRSARREHHRLTAKTLLEEFSAQAELRPELVAYHYAAAQMSHQAADFWGKAGERSIASSAYAEAIAQFGSGLEHLSLLPATPDRSHHEIELRVRLGVALIATRGYAANDVKETYSRAAQLCDELGAALPLRVLYGVWVVNFVRGDLPSSRLIVPNLERLAQQTKDSASALVAYAALVTWAFWRGDYTKVAKYYAAASTLYDSDQPKRQHEELLREHGFEGLLYPRLYFAWSQVIAGDTDGGLETWREAAKFGERVGDPYTTCEVLAFGAALHHDLGNFRLEGELADQVRDIASNKGFLFWLALALGHRGLATVSEGDAERGIATVKESLDLFQKMGVKATYSYFLCYLAEAYLTSGRLDDARSLLNQALDLARTHVDSNYEPEMLRVAGETSLARGDLDAARATFLEALGLSRARGAKLFELRSATSLARVLRLQGDAAQAKKLLTEARAPFRQGLDLPPIQSADALLLEL